MRLRGGGEGEHVGVAGGEDDVVELVVRVVGGGVEGGFEGGFVVAAAEAADVRRDLAVRVALLQASGGRGDAAWVRGGDVHGHAFCEAKFGDREAYAAAAAEDEDGLALD